MQLKNQSHPGIAQGMAEKNKKVFTFCQTRATKRNRHVFRGWEFHSLGAMTEKALLMAPSDQLRIGLEAMISDWGGTAGPARDQTVEASTDTMPSIPEATLPEPYNTHELPGFLLWWVPSLLIWLSPLWMAGGDFFKSYIVMSLQGKLYTAGGNDFSSYIHLKDSSWNSPTSLLQPLLPWKFPPKMELPVW